MKIESSWELSTIIVSEAITQIFHVEQFFHLSCDGGRGAATSHRAAGRIRRRVAAQELSRAPSRRNLQSRVSPAGRRRDDREQILDEEHDATAPAQREPAPRVLRARSGAAAARTVAVVDVVPAGAIADDLLAQLPCLRPPAACHDDDDDDGGDGDGDEARGFSRRVHRRHAQRVYATCAAAGRCVVCLLSLAVLGCGARSSASSTRSRALRRPSRARPRPAAAAAAHRRRRRARTRRRGRRGGGR